MDRDDAREALARHAHRPIRAFLRNPGLNDDGTADAEEAFWFLVYADVRQVDHDTAAAVDEDLSHEARAVQIIIDGWRPAALRSQQS